jgi:hypothetical protein
MKKVLLIIAGVVLVACVVGGFFGYRAYQTFGELKESSITQQEFDAQSVGGAETAVRDALPKPLKNTDDQDIYGKDDPGKQGKPDGSSCIYYAVKPIADSGDRPMFRFCFAGGKLVEKKQIRIVGK